MAFNRFDRNADRRGGRGGFGGGRSFGGGFGGRGRDRDSGRREMFDATCTQCGAACQVPFKPTGAKPVLCSNCFSKGTPSTAVGSSALDTINKKLDKIIAILEQLELTTDESETEDDTDDNSADIVVMGDESSDLSEETDESEDESQKEFSP